MTLRQILWKDLSDKAWTDPTWQMKNRLFGLSGLKKLPFLNPFHPQDYTPIIERYKWASTPYYLNLIDLEDPENCPIRAQVIPNKKEISFSLEDSSPDPLCEKRYMPVQGLIHRYKDRALVLATNFCASLCRHCNRKRAWNSPESLSLSRSSLKTLKEYLKVNRQIREIIISGGDPLTLPLKRLEFLLSFFSSFDNIKVLRIGTRLPVVLPMGITQELCDLLKRFRPIWINTHFNHPVEITPESKAAIELLITSGIPVSNQTVLLKGVNDSDEILKDLFYKLQEIMVRPYYLFQCDHVSGVDHFRVPLSKGIGIFRRLWCNISGLSMPRFVADLPGGQGKARIVPAELIEHEDGEAVFSTFEGGIVKVRIS